MAGIPRLTEGKSAGYQVAMAKQTHPTVTITEHSSPRRPWVGPYILRRDIVAAGLASLSTCVRAEASGYLTSFRRGGRGHVVYLAEQVDRWIRGDVPVTPA